MKLKSVLAMATVTLLLVSGTAFAWPGKGQRQQDNCGNRGQGMSYEQHEQRMENRLEKMAVILDLSEDQQTKMKDLAESNWEKRQELRAKMQTSRDDLRSYRGKEDFDIDEYRAKVQENANLKVDMAAQRVEHRKAVMALLTPEQQEKAGQLWDMQKENRGKKGFGKGNCDRSCDQPMKRCGKRQGQGYRNS